MEELLSSLNDAQREIVTWCEGPQLVLAGAGSGKTRAVTYKIAYLLKNLHFRPWEVLAMTFTNKAAGEMKHRVRNLVGPPAEGVLLGTFHSMCARWLRRYAELVGHSSNYTIHDSDDSAAVMKQVLKDQNVDEKKIGMSAKALVAKYDWVRNRFVGDLDEWVYESDTDGEVWHKEKLAELFDAYEGAKKRLDAMDFHDLLRNFQNLLAGHEEVRSEFHRRLQYVLVDEMQDTNRVQLELLRLLVGPHQRICAVGDDDQSIYGWRGARVENMLEFDQVFKGAKIMRMEQNYRSTRTVLEAAHSVIVNNTRRHEKKLWTENAGGERLILDAADTESDEAVRVARHIARLRSSGISLREMAIFYRTHAQSRSFEEVLMREGVRYAVFGGLRFYERAEIKDALAYLRLIANPRDEVSLVRVINKPARGIGDVGIGKLREAAAARDVSLYEAAVAVSAADEIERWVKPFVPFVTMVESWRNAVGTIPASELLVRVLLESGYTAMVEALDPIEAESRGENLEELVAGVSEFEETWPDAGLEGYLEQIALITDIDKYDPEQDIVSLMTVHMAKGLEFDVVFVTGLEDGIFPHKNSLDEGDIEEERRLFYVALTRARKKVFLTHAASRVRFGQWEELPRSQFLDEIPGNLVEVVPARGRRSFMSAMGARQATVSRAPQGPSDVVHAQWGRGKVMARIGTGADVCYVVKFEDGKVRSVSGTTVKTF